MQELRENLKGIATLGRFEDDTLAHVATGEMVLPPDILDNKLLMSLKKKLEDKGYDDFDSFFVGSDTASINPITGLPEYGFSLKRALGIKGSVSKKLKKLGKKIAPIAAVGLAVGLPFAAPFVLAMGGTAIGAAAAAGGIGAAAGSFLGGKKPKDVITEGAKGAALSAAMATVASGIKGVKDGVGFAEGVKAGANVSPEMQALMDKSSVASEVTSGSQPAISGGEMTQLGDISSIPTDVSGLPDVGSTGIEDMVVYGQTPSTPSLSDLTSVGYVPPTITNYSLTSNDASTTDDGGLAEDVKDFFTDDIPEYFKDAFNRTKQSVSNLDPALLALSTAYGKLAEKEAKKYQFGQKDIRDLRPEPQPYSRGFDLGFAEGGIAELDMRGGGESIGPGTGTSDDIPAMLSDGEFVMTAKANNGAGGFKITKSKVGLELIPNGKPNRKKGAANMMKLMKHFERFA